MGAVAVVTRRRHPFEGRSLEVLGRMRRHGRVELLVVLPDGSKSLLPADWTDLGDSDSGDKEGPATLGSLTDLLAAVGVRTGITEGGGAGNQAEGQPTEGRADGAQRAAVPDERRLPAPPPLLLEALPEEAVAAVLDRLSRLMARAVRPDPAAHSAKGGDDE